MAQAIRFKNKNRPNISFSVGLDGVRFKFSFSYNYRDSFWYFSLSDKDGEVVNGVRVISGWPMLKTYSSERLPKQRLMFLSLVGQELNPNFTSLGVDHVLMYGDD